MESESEYERRGEWIKEENRLEAEAEGIRARETGLTNSWLDGVRTGDYNDMYAKIGLSPESTADTGDSSMKRRFDVALTKLRAQVRSSVWLPEIWTGSWQWLLSGVSLETSQVSSIGVEQMINEVEFVREQFRPQRQGIDLNAYVQVEFAREVLRLQESLRELRSILQDSNPP